MSRKQKKSLDKARTSGLLEAPRNSFKTRLIAFQISFPGAGAASPILFGAAADFPPVLLAQNARSCERSSGRSKEHTKNYKREKVRQEVDMSRRQKSTTKPRLVGSWRPQGNSIQDRFIAYQISGSWRHVTDLM